MHHHITEDTPPDMLAGAMDLVVRLPDGREVNMAVERSTPMMDLLVHLTTANKLKPSDHLLQALDMSTDRTLPYKPNTPIGALDTQRVRVYPKGSAKGFAPRVPVGQQPFESTFRLQVHLPRNQFCVIRVGKYVLLEDIMKKVCEEKNLDPKKFEFRHPANIDKVLDPKRTLNDYEITEITVVHRGSSGHLCQALSSTDIMALQREDERRKMQAKTGGGVLNLIFKRGRNSMGSGSISSDTRSISPTQSDDSRSVTPPAIPQTIQPPVLKSPTKESVQVQIQNQNRPKPPLRKRRPAPKPPAITQSKSLPEIISTTGRPEVPKNLNMDTVQQQQKEEEEEEIPASQKLENGLTICHSRNSSDSSGYHEASILSDNCNTTLPRRPKSIGINSSNSNISMEQRCDFRKSTGNLANMAVQSKSTISLTTAGRKKKAPPPPPSLSSANSAASITSSISSPPNSDIADVVVVNASSIKRVVELPKSNSTSDSTAPPTPNDTHSLPRTSTVSLASTKSYTPETASLQSSLNEDSKVPSRSSQEERRIPEKMEQIKTNIIQEEEKECRKKETKKKNSETHSIQDTPDDLDAEWQYTLPSPPTAFRDASPTNFTDVTNYDTVTFNGLTSDSIVTSPALFEKLESISHTRSEVQQAEVEEEEEDTISNASSMKNKKSDIIENVEAEKHAKDELPTAVAEIKQEEVLTSKYLSLETLEKRKSLVLERELASLKNAQNTQNEAVIPATEPSTTSMIRSQQRDSLKNEIEEVLQNRSRSATLSRTNSQSREKLLLLSAADSSALPNFKITTYDQPKSKINIFEDDSIRSSNIDGNKQQAPKTTIQSIQSEDMDMLRRKRNTNNNSSSENIYFAKRNSMDDFMFKKPELPPKFNKKQSGVIESIENKYTSDAAAVSRSESFSMQKQKHIWNRTSPVKRSKSHISLDKYNKEEPLNEESLHKSNSLYNVSGLQSLEVMRMILPKLGNTPPSSPSEDKQVNPLDDRKEITQAPPFIPAKPEVPKEQSQSTKKYQYSGPPAINFASWSERPKTQVSIKEDTDYKFNNIKAKFNGSQENGGGTVKTQSYPSVNIRVHSKNSKDQVDSGKINIKINGDEPNKTISQQQSGNVVIKIGSNTSNSKNGEDEKVQKNSLYTRFLNQTTAVGYRKPLGNINGVDKPRPHSIAFDASCPDLSRVPIVRAVELKKPFKETPGNNKSITQILHDTSYQTVNGTEDAVAVNSHQEDKSMMSPLGNQYRHSSVYLSNENINKSEQNGGNKVLSVFPSKSISRGNSFANPRINSNINNVNPVVKGFRDNNDQKKVFSFNNLNNNNNNNNNISNINNSKSIENSNFVPFSQHTLRRTQDSPQKQISQTERERETRSIFETVTLRKTATTANRHSLPATVEIKNPQQVLAPPPPPKLPKTFGLTNKKPIQRQLPVEDPRDQLLESIRNFGGKSGLKTVKL